MRKIKLVVISVLAALLLAGCSRPLEDRVESFVERTEARCDSYSEADWDKSIKEYQALMQEYKDNYKSYTKEQRDAINKALGRYSGILVKRGINAAGNAVQDAIDGASSFLNGILDSLGGEE